MYETNCPSCSSSYILDDYEIGQDITCPECGAIYSIEIEQTDVPGHPLSSDLSKVLISTGDIPGEYEVIDTIFAMAAKEVDLSKVNRPSYAFHEVREKLRKNATEYGGDAAIHCRFEYNVPSNRSVFGHKHMIEFFGYGTAVKRKK